MIDYDKLKLAEKYALQNNALFISFYYDGQPSFWCQIGESKPMTMDGLITKLNMLITLEKP